MRIRKRPVPLPLSSLSPVPLSDPRLLSLNHCSSSVQQQLHDPKPSQRLYHVGPQLPSDHHHHPNRRPINPTTEHASDSSPELMMTTMKEKNYCSETLKGEEEEKEEEEEDEAEGKGNYTRKGSVLCAETVSGFPSELSSSSSHRVLGKWFEGEKAFPFKKRRGSFGEGTRMEREKRLSTQTKMDKKCDGERISDEKKQEHRGVMEEGLDHSVGDGMSPKKRARGNAIMEGSRCSRVNGRGWRCCQQTLVGYSLCEHHLGKGRLRSLNSVRSRSSVGSVNTKSKRLSKHSCLDLREEEEHKPDKQLDVNHHGDRDQQRKENEHEHGEEEKPLVVTKKRMKLGIVKARSMSSLLGQTNSASVVDDENNK